MIAHPEGEGQHQPTNGAHPSPTLPDGWQETAALMWSLWTEPERLDRILDTPVTEEWYQREPCDFLGTLAYFRPVPAEWGRIWERFKSLGGKPTLLEAAIQSLLSDPQTARAGADGTPTDQAEAVPLAMAMVTAPTLLHLHLPPRETYFSWLRARTLTMVYGPTAVGKTMFLMGLGLALATAKPFLTWRAPETAVPVLYVDGEMSLKELQERLEQLAGPDPPAGLTFLPSELVYERVGRDLTLTEACARAEIDAMVEAHSIRVLMLDNVGTLFPGLDESSKKDWEPINAWLIRLRHRGLTVLIGHHAGKNGLQRGTSGRGDNLNTILALTKPPDYTPEQGCHFYLHFEKSRGIKGAAVTDLDVRLEEVGARLVLTAKPLEATRTDQVKRMLAEGIPVKAIAEELTIQLSYVYRLKKSMGL